MFKSLNVVVSLVYCTLIFTSSFVLAFEEIRQEQVVVNEFPIQYLEAGNGKSLLFVHGAISDSRLWEPYVSLLGKERKIIAYTQRYHGIAPWPDDAKTYSRAQHIDDLIGFIEKMKLQPVDIVTHSYSGGIALQAMLKRPDLFRSAIHYEPAMTNHIEGAPGFGNATKVFRSGFGPVIKALEDGNQGESALRFAEAVFGLPQGGISEIPEEIQNIFSDNGRTIPSFLEMENWEHYDCAALGNIQVPQLVVQGGNSHTFFSMAAESISTCLPNSLLVTMQGATHSGPALEIERFAKLIMGFQHIVE